MNQISETQKKRFPSKYKKPITLSLAIIIVVAILITPILPIKYTATETRTRNLRHSSKVYGLYNVPTNIKVTNTDSHSGRFSVTMNMWYSSPNPFNPQKKLEDTFSKSLFINARTTETFHLPSDWIIIEPMYSFTYSVSTPSVQESYDVIKTEYKSILTLILE